MNTIGERIRYIREGIGVSQAHFGKAIGQNRLVVARWEGGTQVPREPQLSALSNLLSVPYEWLTTGDGVPPPITEETKRALRAIEGKAHLGLGVPSVRERKPVRDSNRATLHPGEASPDSIPAFEIQLQGVSKRVASMMDQNRDWPSIPGLGPEVMLAFARQRAIPSMRMIAALAEAFGVQEEWLLYGGANRAPRGSHD